MSSAPVPTGAADNDGSWLINTGEGVQAIASDRLAYATTGYKCIGGSLLGGHAPTSCVPPLHGWRLNVPASLDFDYYFQFNNGVSPGFSAQDQSDIAEEARKWIDVADWTKVIAPADGGHAANTTIVRAGWRDPDTLGETVFDGVTSYWRPSESRHKDRYGIPVGEWGIALRADQTDPGQHVHRFQATALHEFGHLIGFGHVQKGCSENQFVMVTAIDDFAPLDPTAADRIGVALLVYLRVFGR